MNNRLRLVLALTVAAAGCSGSDEPTDGGVTADAATEVDSGVAVDAGPEPCESWLIEYALDGSEFEIRGTPFGAGDAVNTIGPGRMVLRFPGDESGPQAGEVKMVSHQLELEFEVAMVETDVTHSAGPDDCGVASGTRTSSVVAWTSPVSNYNSMGTVTCRAGEFLCGAAGLPVDEPVPQDMTRDQPLMPFAFEADDDFARFTMGEVEIPNDSPGETFLRLTGVQTTRRCARLPVDCN